jgi:retinoid hydroxylase
MESVNQDLLVLAEEQALPPDAIAPPRKPQWFDTFAYIADPDRFCKQNLDRYGAIFQTGIFGGTTVLLGDARAIQMAFNGDSEYTEISLPPTTMAMFGEYSLFQRPDLHRQRKSALTPGFMGKMLAGYLPHIQQTIARHLADWDINHPLPLVPKIEDMSFDILAVLLLGVRVDLGDTAFPGLPIASKQELKQLYQTFFAGFYGLVKWDSPLTVFGRGLRARRQLLQFMQAVVKQRRANPGSEQIAADFLGMMLASQQAKPDGVFNDTFIENQCLLQLWASHYEIMGLLSAWVYQIGQYPDILAKLRSTQETLVTDLDLTLEDLKSMEYLEATIKETLRILPPTSTANRRLTKSVVLDGVRYQKGWTLIAEPRIAHKIDAYFSHPDRFDPDRFLPDRGEGKMYEFIPFGGGIHACLGAQLALTIAKIFAVNFIHRFDWQVTDKANFIQFPLRRIRDEYQIKLNRH